MSPPQTLADILVVDDTPANLQLLVGLLTEAGYNVRPVTNGEAALKAISLRLPDLILLDITMPGLDGYQVCQQLKENVRTRDIPVVFISALSDVEEKVHAFRAGGVDYVTKPFQVEEVLARVRTHLSLRQATREALENYAKLKVLEEQRDNLVHMVVHDMRSPLLSLSLGLEMIAESVPREDLLAQRLVRDSRGCAQSVIEMANQMLTVSKLESGMPLAQTAPADLSVLAAEAAEAHRALAGMRDLRVELTAPLAVVVDQALIRRAIDNLISNAIKHTPARNGLIRVATDAAEGFAYLRVHDNGRGVDPANKRLLYTKFGQLQNQDTRRGFGLGLAFVKLAIETHGGTVGLESRAGGGSTFWFRLPQASEAGTTTQVRHA